MRMCPARRFMQPSRQRCLGGDREASLLSLQALNDLIHHTWPFQRSSGAAFCNRSHVSPPPLKHTAFGPLRGSAPPGFDCRILQQLNSKG